MQKTPKGLRIQIGIFGRRNVGKSSLLNALTSQNVSIVSNIAGTTTDPVEKPMELLPLGPVLFIDTAGIDDMGSLGKMRIEKSKKIIQRSDLAIIVTTAQQWGSFEETLLNKLQKQNTPIILAINKTDLQTPQKNFIQQLKQKNIKIVQTIACQNHGITQLKNALINHTPKQLLKPTTIVADLIPAGELAILVVPIDLEAPKGRLIMPQVQTIRDILDNDSACLIVKERELTHILKRLNIPPAIVITDSQAFLKVDADVPNNIPLTSFSILFARLKGDLETFVEGAMNIEKLRPNDNILIAEACTHHPIGEDIGRIKIPRWLTQYVGGKLNIEHTAGQDFPNDISKYKLIIHCGSCTFNSQQLQNRINICKKANVPITNYGMAIAYSLGIFQRALSPFPLAKQIYQTLSKT